MNRDMTSRAQIKEIAEMLNLSSSTVSAVLGGRAETIRISKKTQDRVWEAAKLVNYQPNIYARRLRQAANEETPYVIGLFWRQDNLNSRLGRFIQGIQSGIEKGNYRVELMVQPFKPGEIMQNTGVLSGNRLSGAIICGLLEDEQRELEKQDYSIPIVMIGRKSEVFHCVSMDSFAAGENCVELLSRTPVASGAMICFTKGGRSESLMRSGFMKACEERGIDAGDKNTLYIDSSSHEQGYAAADELLQRVTLPSAWLVGDCRLAGGILDCCNERGIRIPEDLKLIFFEDSGLLQYSKPPLASLDVPVREMAEKALEILIGACEKNISEAVCVEMNPLYYIRESCGATQ